jgi:hypothetical protein
MKKIDQFVGERAAGVVEITRSPLLYRGFRPDLGTAATLWRGELADARQRGGGETPNLDVAGMLLPRTIQLHAVGRPEGPVVTRPGREPRHIGGVNTRAAERRHEIEFDKSQIPAAFLFEFQRLEQGLEVALAEALAAAAADDFEEEGRAVLQGLGEEL